MTTEQTLWVVASREYAAARAVVQWLDDEEVSVAMRPFIGKINTPIQDIRTDEIDVVISTLDKIIECLYKLSERRGFDGKFQGHVIARMGSTRSLFGMIRKMRHEERRTS